MRHLAQLIDTLPTHWRLKAVQQGAAAHTRPDIAFADIGKAIVRYRQAGSGPSLVFAADPPVPIEMYDELLDALASHFRVTVFEMPGFGASLPRVGFRYSMSQATSGVAAFLKQLGNGPHHLALPCVMGFVTTALARQHPELVNQLVLIQTPDWAGGQHWLHGRDPKGLLRTPLVGQLALAAVRQQRIRGWYRMALADQSQLDRYTETTLQHFHHGGCFCLASAFQDFLSDAQGLVGPVPQRALAIWGGADPSHRDTVREATLQLAPNAELVRFDSAGHFPELEQPQRFARLVCEFLH